MLYIKPFAVTDALIDLEWINGRNNFGIFTDFV